MSVDDLQREYRALLKSGPPIDTCSRILEIIPHIVFVKDLRNRVTWCNDACVKTLGFAREDLLSMSLDDLLGEDEAEHFLANDLEVARTGKPKLKIIESLTTPDGETRWYRTDKLPMYDASESTVLGIIGFAVEITDIVGAQGAS